MCDVAMRLVHDHCRCCYCSAPLCCQCLLGCCGGIPCCRLEFRIPSSNTAALDIASMLSTSVTNITSRPCFQFLMRPHFRPLRWYIVPPHVRIASLNAHSNSSFGSIAFRGSRWPVWSQSDFRRLSSRLGQSAAAASTIQPSQELHSPRDCY